MKYLLIKKKMKFKKCSYTEISGFLMKSKNGTKIKIKDVLLYKLEIVNKRLAHPYVIKIVEKKYKILINNLTDLMVDDTDSGESLKEGLNMIEKFRQEIKNKYRNYLLKKDLEFMSKKLQFMQKQIKMKEIELINRLTNTKSNYSK